MRRAVAFDSTRGDEITVTSSRFLTVQGAAPPLDVPASSGPRLDVGLILTRLIRPVLGLLAIVAMMVLGLKFAKQLPAAAARPLPRPRRGQQALPQAPEELEDDIEYIAPQISASTKLKNQVKREAEGSPETTARVIQAWLGEATT